MKVGIDLGGTNMRVALVDNGRLVKKEIVACPSKASCEEVLSRLIGLIDRVMCPEVESIGVGVPSVVDSREGIVYNVVNIPSWKEVPLKRLLQEYFNVPVLVNNDSNSFAWGVKLFGEGREFSNMVGMTLGTGVGAGIIVDDKLYGGRNTGVGEIGSLPYLNSDYEHYCSSGFFVEHYNLTGKEAAERAITGDACALEVWNAFGTHVGNLMKAVLFTYDPDAIVIGGGIASAFSFYEPAMRGAMSDFPYPETIKNIRILVSQVEDVALLGASALA